MTDSILNLGVDAADGKPKTVQHHSTGGALHVLPTGPDGAGSIALAEDAPSATGDVGVQLLAVRKAAPGNLSDTDGDYEPLQVSEGRLWVKALLEAVAGAGPANAAQASYASSVVAKASAGTIYGLAVYNSSILAQFIQLHDAASLPANGSAPAYNIEVQAGSSLAVDFGVYGMQFTSGIVACNSTTAQTKTLGAADCQFFIRYK